MSYPGGGYPYQQAGGYPSPYPQQPGQQPYPGGQYPANPSPYPTQGGVFPPSLGFATNAPMYMPQPSYPTAASNQGGYPGSQQGYPGSTGSSYPGPTGSPYPGSTSSPYPGAGPTSHTPAPYPGSGSALHSTGGSYGAPYPGSGSASAGSYGAPYPGGHAGPTPASRSVNASYAPPSHGSSTQVMQKRSPTVVPASPFNPVADAEVLRKAMKGFGTDEKAIISVLSRRTNAQRLEIAVQFKTMYGKDLLKDLKSELTGRFEDLVLSLMTPLPQFYSKQLNNAVSGIGTDEDTLIEVLCTLSNNEIRTIKAAYHSMYGTHLESDLRGDTGGNFKRLMVALCTASRDESGTINQAAAVADAQQLLRAGELRFGTDESTFNVIFCQRNYNQLRLVFDEYQRLTGHDIEKAIKHEFSGDIEQGLLAVIRSIRNQPGFFAKRLEQSMAGMGTTDEQLIRIIVTRCEIDMGDIKREYMAKYGKSLADRISGDTSGDYKKCLLALIGEY